MGGAVTIATYLFMVVYLSVLVTKMVNYGQDSNNSIILADDPKLNRVKWKDMNFMFHIKFLGFATAQTFSLEHVERFMTIRPVLDFTDWTDYHNANSTKINVGYHKCTKEDFWNSTEYEESAATEHLCID